MPHYLLTVHSSTSEPSQQVTPDEMEHSMSEILAVNAALRSSGAWVYGGQLDPPTSAKVVKPRNSKIRVTDGPFIEAKELTGGFAVIKAESLEEAIEWCKRFRTIVGDGESEIVRIFGPDDFGPA